MVNLRRSIEIWRSLATSITVLLNAFGWAKLIDDSLVSMLMMIGWKWRTGWNFKSFWKNQRTSKSENRVAVWQNSIQIDGWFLRFGDFQCDKESVDIPRFNRHSKLIGDFAHPVGTVWIGAHKQNTVIAQSDVVIQNTCGADYCFECEVSWYRRVFTRSIML